MARNASPWTALLHAESKIVGPSAEAANERAMPCCSAAVTGRRSQSASA